MCLFVSACGCYTDPLRTAAIVVTTIAIDYRAFLYTFHSYATYFYLHTAILFIFGTDLF